MPRFVFAALLCVALAAPTAFAQKHDSCNDPCAGYKQPVEKNVYLSADTTIRSEYPYTNFFVGDKDAPTKKTAPVTLTVEKGAIVAGWHDVAPGGSIGGETDTCGVNVWGNNRLELRGGVTHFVNGHDAAMIQIYGGNHGSVIGKDTTTVNVFSGNKAHPYVFNSGTLNILGGDVPNACVFDSATMNVSGGKVDMAGGCQNSVVNVSGGTVDRVDNNNGAGTINILGGTIHSAMSMDGGTVNVSGGNIGDLAGQMSSTLNISGGAIGRVHTYAGNTTINVSGGTITRGIMLQNEEDCVNFVGSDLRYRYAGIVPRPNNEGDSDKFIVTGNIGGNPAASYGVLVPHYPATGESPEPNATPRQFALNGVTVSAPPSSNWIRDALIWTVTLFITVAVWLRRR